MRLLSIRFPEGKAKLFTLSYDDGIKQDIRLLALMNKYGIKGTFNLNSNRFAPSTIEYDANDYIKRHLLSREEALTLYASPNVEVAIHGAEHIFPSSVPTSVAMKEYLNDRLALEKMFGKIIRGCAYPYGMFNDDTVDILGLCGIVYARTVKNSYTFDIPTDWLRLAPTCHHNSVEVPALIEKFITSTPDRDPFFFYMWGHSYEFDEKNNWEHIEDILSKVGNRDDVWYCTNIEAYEYINAFKSLVFSTDGSMIHNPTSYMLWAQVELPVNFNDRGRMPTPDRRVIKIAPGETVKL